MQSTNIVFPAPNQVEVREEPVSLPRTGEVLCEAEVSLISTGTETYCLRGVFDAGTNWADWVHYPFYPGYSMVARVVNLGPSVQNINVGDRIAAYIGHCQRFTVPAHEVIRVPDGVDAETACWTALAVTTQLGVRRAELALGETVGVIGLGLLGQLVVQYLLLAGARHVVAIDTVMSRLELARAHGATHTLPIDAHSARDRIAAITNGRMLDAVFDVTGHPAVLAPSIQLVRKLGRVILLGDTPTPSQQFLGPGVVSNSVAILGIHGMQTPASQSEYTPWTRDAMASLFFDYLLQGRMRVKDLITHRFSPLAAPQVYHTLVTDRSGLLGVVFDWSRLNSEPATARNAYD
jgi:2-desacetyl-2-hydroxyethyl bacteriochlorophyllide A dehydrogenase